MESSPNNQETKKIGMIKFQSTFASQGSFIKKVIPGEKRQAEFYLSILFAQYLLFNNTIIDKIELNKQDENKGADINARINGKDIGIQLTRLVPDDYLSRRNAAFEKSFLLARDIAQRLTVNFQVNINIFPKNASSKKIPSRDLKSNNSLVDEIVQNLKTEIDNNRLESNFTNKAVINKEAQKIAKSYSFYKIPSGQFSTFPGINNIHVNFDFDSIHITNSELSRQIDKIYENKNQGSAELLIIWADQHEILEQVKEVADLIKVKFSESSFSEVYFMTFLDRIDLFRDSLKINKLK